MTQARRTSVWLLAVGIALAVAIAGTLIVVSKTRAAARAKAARTAAVVGLRAAAPPIPPPLRNEQNRQLLASVPKGDTGSRVLLGAFLALKEREGRDNALIHYVVGGWSMPPVTGKSNDIWTTISNVITNGWGPSAEILRPYLAAWQPGFREIRKGASLNCARGVGFDQGYMAPVPNFLAAQSSAKALCVEGRLFECEGRTTEALANYLTVATMGRDYTTTGSFLISHLIGYACESIALKRIEGLVASGRLDQISLEGLLARLKDVERTHSSAVEALAGEMEMQKSWPAQLKADPEAFHSEAFGGEPATLWDVVEFHDKETLRKFYRYQVERYQMSHNLDRVEPDLKALTDIRTKALQTPWWEFDMERYTREWDQRVAESHPIVRMWAPNFMEERVRYLTTLSRLRACQVSAAVMAWKKKHGALPASLTELRAEYFPGGLPIDPFSGRNFIYSAAGGHWRLASAGPDKVVSAQELRYDPTNGTVSGGDITYVP